MLVFDEVITMANKRSINFDTLIQRIEGLT